MKRIAFAALFLFTLAISLTLTQHRAHATGTPIPDVERQRILIGYRIAPVPLDLRGHNYELVGLGSYLVNAASGCNDCHTNPSYAPGGNPFLGQPKHINTAGYLKGGQAFGPFISRSLVPEDGLPAGRTYEQFVDIMRHGTDYDLVHPKISPLLQVMPWPTYQDLSEHDLRAMYEYLSTLPPASAN